MAPKKPESQYQPSPSSVRLEEIFCFKYRRKVRNDHTIHWGARLYKITAEFGFSLAKREIEIRLSADGTIRGLMDGRDLELKLVPGRAHDEKVAPNRPVSPGLRLALKPKVRRKTCLNI